MITLIEQFEPSNGEPFVKLSYDNDLSDTEFFHGLEDGLVAIAKAYRAMAHGIQTEDLLELRIKRWIEWNQ